MKKLRFTVQLGLGCLILLGLWTPVAAQQMGQKSHPILAHRGVHQTYSREGLERDTCTATRINPPTHDFIENTIPSLLATVALGADVIEVDVHPTTDGDFVVFHDWTLECRTNGTGVTRRQTMADLRGLDVGYGYTADQGATYPLRGKGVGLMVNLEEVLKALPSTQVLINIKSRDPEEGRKLAAYLAKREISPDRVMVYGHEVPVATYMKAAGPEFRAFSKKQVADCLKSYVAWGWSGFVPQACKRSVILVPHSHTGFIWGWRSNFAKRMAKVGSRVYLVGPVPKNSQSSLGGLNDPALLKGLPEGVGVWTDTVETIAPALAGK
ncbi:MAG: glycerophosphodiester phosphodiesterase family protein [Aquidulcibacter sp.]|jgi:glycerophosphoryl diester phosphodiesterase|uniref:glycerophosphodiester phosphodiesterase family protein n=1 Tax=Aquidulcibacter sp. TaxID=2052990 RepID=UPI0022C2569E|nr:glycerophosphodiester phosphodiesterase family protein [Aquidulcibacter sp.]